MVIRYLPLVPFTIILALCLRVCRMTLTPNTFICYIKLSHWQQEHQTQNNFLFTFRKSAKSFKIFDLDKAYRLQLSNIIYSIRIQSCEPYQ